jgi:hypothetical protein
MLEKVIASDLRIKKIKNVEVDLYLECKGLMAVIYHHAKLYDDYLYAKDEAIAKFHYKGVKMLGGILNATIDENFDLKDKLALIGEAQALCLRMQQEAKHEKIKKQCYKMQVMYNGLATHHMNLELLKNTPIT